MSLAFSLSIPNSLPGLILRFNDGKLLSLSITENQTKSGTLSILNNNTDSSAIENTIQQLDGYFSRKKSFRKLALEPVGTPFQQSVWTELSNIPIGETQTYGDIAKTLNSSARAVGNACRKNPIQIIIPCHRVISAKGLGGYAGKTDGQQMNIKRWLLNHEGIQA